MARRVLADEKIIRALIATSYVASQDGENPGAVRPMFRTELVEAILEGSPRLAPRDVKEIRIALLTVVSAEAVLALKDTGACEDGDIVGTIGSIAARVATGYGRS